MQEFLCKTEVVFEFVGPRRTHRWPRERFSCVFGVIRKLAGYGDGQASVGKNQGLRRRLVGEDKDVARVDWPSLKFCLARAFGEQPDPACFSLVRTVHLRP